MLGARGAVSAQPPAPESPARPCARLFAVIHKVTLDQEGRILRTEVEGIVTSSGNVSSPSEASSIDLNLPPAYLVAARRFLESRDYAGGQSPFWTFTLYDPTQPDKANPCRGN